MFRRFDAEYERFKGLPAVSADFRRFKSELLQHLAWVMMKGDEQRPTEFALTLDRTQAEKRIEQWLNQRVSDPATKAKEWLEDLLEHHLLQVAADLRQIEFHHQLFQEYYAAEALLAMFRDRDPQVLQPDQLEQNYLNYLKWTEVMAIVLSLMDNEVQALQVVQLALNVDLTLGARLAGEVNPSLQERTIEVIQDLEVPERLKIYLLCQIHCDIVVPTIAPFICDTTFDIRYTVAHALRKIGSTRVVDELFKLLEECNYSTYLAIAMTLINIPDQRVIDKLINYLDYQSPNYRRTSAYALGEIGSEKPIEKLLEKIQDPDFSVRQEAIAALAKINTDTAITGLINAFEDKNTDISLHWSLINALTTIRSSKKVVDTLLRAISEPKDYDSIYNVIEALGRVGSEEHISKISDYLYYPDSLIQLYAAEAIRDIGGNSAMSLLTRELESKNFYIRWSVAVALSKTDKQFNISVLTDALAENNSFIQSRAVAALGHVGNETVVPQLVSLLNNDDTDWLVCCDVIDALRNIECQAAIDALINAVDSKKEDIRKNSALALGEIRCEAAVTKLQNVLQKDPILDVRRSVVEALGQIGSHEVIDTLINALKDTADPDVSGTAAEALGNIGGEQAMAGLLAALNSLNDEVRGSAAESLGKISDARSLVELWWLCQQHGEDYFWNAISAIQNRCKFYNYDLYQAHLATQKTDRPKSQSSDRPVTYEVNAEVVQIVENNYGTIHGKQAP